MISSGKVRSIIFKINFFYRDDQHYISFVRDLFRTTVGIEKKLGDDDISVHAIHRHLRRNFMFMKNRHEVVNWTIINWNIFKKADVTSIIQMQLVR